MALRTALAATLLVLLAGCAEDPAPVADDPEADESTGQTETPPGDQASDSPAAGEDGTSADDQTVPVYFVADTERAGPRLYREFRRVPAGNPLERAAALLTSGDALDPDYRTLFPGGAFEAVEYVEAAGAIIATLPDEAWKQRPPGMSAREARLAAQQLVYTLQGVQQRRLPVVVQLGNTPVPLFGVDTADGLSQAAPLAVLSHVSLTSPEQGSTVSGEKLRVSGVGNSFEANLGWEIRHDDHPVKEGFATLSGWTGNKLYPFEVTVDVGDLDPGDYSFWVTTDDPSGGAEGIGAMTDDKDFTIE